MNVTCMVGMYLTLQMSTIFAIYFQKLTNRKIILKKNRNFDSTRLPSYKPELYQHLL